MLHFVRYLISTDIAEEVGETFEKAYGGVGAKRFHIFIVGCVDRC